MLVGLVTLLSACAATDAVSDSSVAPPTASTQSSPSLAAASTVPSPARPPAASSAELSYRTELMPWPTDSGLSPELAELLAAFDRGDDWTGTLTGIALLEVSADRWHMCWAIDESFPVSCGSGVVLSTAPLVYLDTPERFETQTSDENEGSGVIVSKSLVAVQGTFFPDAALFVPDIGQDSAVPARAKPGNGEVRDQN